VAKGLDRVVHGPSYRLFPARSSGDFRQTRALFSANEFGNGGAQGRSLGLAGVESELNAALDAKTCKIGKRIRYPPEQDAGGAAVGRYRCGGSLGADLARHAAPF